MMVVAMMMVVIVVMVVMMFHAPQIHGRRGATQSIIFRPVARHPTRPSSAVL
jgi:hypothetical protein